MTDAGRPRGGGGAADDVLGALSQRVRELQSKLATLQGELDESQRKLGTYEDFDGQIQEALSAALRRALANSREVVLARRGGYVTAVLNRPQVTWRGAGLDRD